jgi:hypothetical protein
LEEEENLKTADHRRHEDVMVFDEKTFTKLGREERFRTVISGMEPRRIAVVMLLPHVTKKC